MSMRRIGPIALLTLALTLGAAQAADTPKLGKPISEADIKTWDITILPDGTNLPPGRGTPAEGAKVYVEKGCAACHGENAKGATNMALVGKPPIDRIEARAVAFEGPNRRVAVSWTDLVLPRRTIDAGVAKGARAIDRAFAAA